MNNTFIDVLTKKYEKLAIAYIKNRVDRVMAGFVYTHGEIMRDIALTMEVHALTNNLIMSDEQINKVVNIANKLTHD